jgi:hypothetical protein
MAIGAAVMRNTGDGGAVGSVDVDGTGVGVVADFPHALIHSAHATKTHLARTAR